MNAEEETNITDIELLTDGRIYVFGASSEVLTILDELQGGLDPEISRRLDLQRTSPPSTEVLTTSTSRFPHVR
jgi:hypothetical protein